MEQLVEDLNQDIVKNPHPIIIQYAENRLKLVGYQTFPILSLMPISLFSPDMITEDGKTIMPNIHTLILSSTGSGKTDLLYKTFLPITYNPIRLNRQSVPDFIERLYQTDNASILVGDIDIIFKDPVLIKILEGVCGEEKEIISSNMLRRRIFKINSIFLGAGLPQSLTRYASYGMMRRICPLVMFHSVEERDVIYDEITKSIFKKPLPTNISPEQISDYYQKIINVQLENDEEFEKVTGYVVDDRFKQGIRDIHANLLLKFPESRYAISELHSGFRYLVTSAMLNLFNRKIEKNGNENNIVVTKEDYERAKKLLYLEMKMKYYIYSSYDYILTDSNTDRLYNQVNNIEDNVYRNIAKIFLQDKMSKKKS